MQTFQSTGAGQRLHWGLQKSPTQRSGVAGPPHSCSLQPSGAGKLLPGAREEGHLPALAYFSLPILESCWWRKLLIDRILPAHISSVRFISLRAACWPRITRWRGSSGTSRPFVVEIMKEGLWRRTLGLTVIVLLLGHYCCHVFAAVWSNKTALKYLSVSFMDSGVSIREITRKITILLQIKY